MPSYLTAIGPSAFMHNNLRDVKFGPNLAIISSYAFAYPKYKFNDIHIPSAIISIGENAFKGNVILNPLNTKKNIVKIDKTLDELSSVFGVVVSSDFNAENKAGFTDGTIISATSDSNYYNGFAYVKDNLMQFCPSNISIDVENTTLVKVGQDATNAYVPEYISYISSGAFQGCTALTSVSMNDDVKFGPSAFYNCNSLIHISSN